MLDFDGTKKARRKDAFLSFCVLALALLLLILPVEYQRPVREAFRTTILRPFIGAQTRLAIRRSRTEDLSLVRAQRDSLAALVAAEATLSEENRQMRGILGMRERVGTKFIPAEVVRLGAGEAESSFLINVGKAEGVRELSPVITPSGLLGIVKELHEHSAIAIDWSHSQFRASVMTAEGGTYGIIAPRRGRTREEDVMALTGAAFTDITPGKRIVTSGRGDLYPRGIPVGVILGIDEADKGWGKSYLVKPAVRPEEARHVLVGTPESIGTDMADIWHVSAPADTASLGDTTSAPPKAKPKPAAKPKTPAGAAANPAGTR